MAVTFTMSAVDFFSKVGMGGEVKFLVDSGVVFKIGFFTIAADWKGKIAQITLPVTTTVIMKNQASPQELHLVALKMKDWLDDLTKEVDKVVVNASLQAVPLALGEQNFIAADVPSMSHNVAKKPFKTAKSAKQAEVTQADMPTDTPVKLADAKYVGQKVRGTSAGSVYHTVAVGAVNLAMKRSGTDLSVRVEGQFNPKLVHALKTSGFSVKDGYCSLHLSVGPDYMPRVVGSLLFNVGEHAAFTDQIQGVNDATFSL